MDSRNRKLLLTLLVSALVVLAGCASVLDDSGYDGDKTADELEAQVLDSSEDIQTASTSLNIMVGDGSEDIEMTMEGVMDFDAEKAEMEGEMDMPTQTASYTQYVIGQTQYIQMDGQWYEEEMHGMDMWDDEYEQYEEAMDEAVDMEIVDETTTNGHDVYVVELEIEESAMEDIVEQEAMGDGIDAQQMEINDVEMEQHVNQETYHINHISMDMDVEQLGQELSMTMEIDYDDINEPVDIELPEEAEDAQSTGAGF